MNSIRFTPLIWVLTLCCLSTGVELGAQEPAFPAASFSEEIVVVAHLTETEVHQVGSSVTVIDAEEIEQRGSTSVVELLRTVPGLAVVQGGGPGRPASVFIRGASSSHTLVLVDGVRVNAPATGAFDLSDLQCDQIERVEVLRGPQSSLYGSEAIGGVINIISKRGRLGLHTSVIGELGSKESFRFGATVDGGSGDVDYRFAATREDLPGFSLASAETHDSGVGRYQNLNAVGRIGLALPLDGRADVSFRHTDATSHPDGYTFGVGPTADPDFEQQRRGSVGGLTIAVHPTSRWRQQLSVSFNQEDVDGSDPSDLFNNYSVTNRTASVTLQSDVVLTANGSLTVGGLYERRDGENLGNYDQSAHISAFFLENQWSWRDRLHLSAAVRSDDHSVFGSKTTYRATGVVGLPKSGLRLHGSWGTGFKAPTLNDLYFPYSGNPELRPETSEGYDLGAGWESGEGRVYADVTYFANDFEDLIGFDFSTWMARNTSRAESYGLETMITLRATRRLQVDLGYTYTSAEDTDTRTPLPRRPKNRYSAAVFFHPRPHIDCVLSVLGVSNRIDSDGAVMDDYYRVDASYSHQVSSWSKLQLKVQNLLDEEYAEVPGYISPGFLGSAAVTVSF